MRRLCIGEVRGRYGEIWGRYAPGGGAVRRLCWANREAEDLLRLKGRSRAMWVGMGAI